MAYETISDLKKGDVFEFQNYTGHYHLQALRPFTYLGDNKFKSNQTGQESNAGGGVRAVILSRAKQENRSFKTLRAARAHATDGQPIINVGGLYVTGNIGPLTCIICVEPNGYQSGEVTIRKLQKGNHNQCSLARGLALVTDVLPALEKINELLQHVKPDHPTIEGEIRSLVLGAIAKTKGE